MDPNAALAAIREDVAALKKTTDAWALAHDLDSLIEHVEALDEWLTKGGFVPAAWSKDQVLVATGVQLPDGAEGDATVVVNLWKSGPPDVAVGVGRRRFGPAATLVVEDC